MHSRWKVEKFYPQVNLTMIRKLYGYGVAKSSKLNWRDHKHQDDNKDKWDEFNKINLTEFNLRTEPTFSIWRCKLHGLNCHRMWRKISTYKGNGMRMRLTNSFQI